MNNQYIKMGFKLLSGGPVALYECDDPTNPEGEEKHLHDLENTVTKYVASITVGRYLVVRNVQQEARISIAAEGGQGWFLFRVTEGMGGRRGEGMGERMGIGRDGEWGEGVMESTAGSGSKARELVLKPSRSPSYRVEVIQGSPGS